MKRAAILSPLFFFCCTMYANAPFILITTLYNETNKKRIQEYKKCIKQNIANPLIQTVHVVYDTMKDKQNKEKNELLQFLCSKDVAITYHSGRPSYGFCFQLAQMNYPEYKIILCNGDIYFNETLTKLVEYDLTGKFLALTRWDERSDSKLVPYRRMRRRDTTDSQDAWIFQLPLPPFEQDNIKMGIPLCDCRIAYQAKKAGLTVINPCKTIQCVHVHRSRKRNYNMRRELQKVCGKPYMVVPWSVLK